MNLREAATVPEAAEGELETPSHLGHFELGRCLGAGGMGVVFEARDTLLDRAVALKLLRPGSDEAGRARLLREAQALARLSHPNVVTVFEVGVAGEQIFAAMELVDGATLRDWMAAPHDWRAAVDLFLAAGRGLAAVHALGLVHRDFKPANVLIDRAGTPKVGDFGLVGLDGAPAADAEGEGERELPALPGHALALTRTGSVMGTPAYMAPEQQRGDRTDARADQYSFAVSLVEAVTGKRPDDGGVAGLPPPLRAIVARALQDEPARRYPSMAPLLADLARARRGAARWWLAAAGAVVIAGAVAFAFGLGRSGKTVAAVDPCPAPEARVGEAWDPAQREALRAHLVAIDPSQGGVRFDLAAAIFDRNARRWSAVHVEACTANRVDGRQSDTLLDHRMACLDRALIELDETVGALASATDPAGLDRAMHAVVGLPSLDACDDVSALTERLPPPTAPARRAEFDALAREIAAIDVTRRVDGRLAGLEERVRAAVARARRLGHPPSLADALRVLARIQLEHEDSEAAVVTQRELVQVGAAAHDDLIVAEAWTGMVGVLGEVLRRPDEAAALIPSASAAVARADDRVDLRVDLLLGQARVARGRRDFARAKELLDESIALLEGAGAGADDSPLRGRLSDARRELANTRAKNGEWEAAAAAYREYLALVTAQLGPDHPDALQASFNLGVSLRQLGRHEESLRPFREAARIGEARLAASPKLAGLLHGVGSTLTQMGQHAEAVPYLERAVAMARATMAAGDARLSKPIGDLGAALFGLDRYDDARPLFVEQLALLEQAEPADQPSDDRINALYNLGNLEVTAKRCAAAKPSLERAIAMYRARDGADSADAAVTRALLAGCRR